MTGTAEMVRLEMLIEVDPTGRRAGAFLRDWLRIGMDIVGGELAAVAWARAPMPAGAASEAVPYGRPGDTWVDLIVAPSHRQKRSEMKPLSAESWQAFLDQAAALPDYAGIRMRTLDESGRPFGVPALDISGSVKDRDVLAGLSQVSADQRWLQLLAYVPMVWLSQERYVDAMTTAWLELADRCDPSFGEVGVGQGERSELETNLAGVSGIAAANIPHARERLRGYGWITLCSRKHGDQLGGEAYFRASNAFWRIVSLGSGGYWLQATPSYGDYDMAAAERVFRALALVLIPGRPIPNAGSRPQHHLVLDDPDPDEADQPRGRGVTKAAGSKLPVFTLVATGEAQTITGSTEWSWELLRDGDPHHGWTHNKPDGDRFIQILAELAVSQDAGRPVAEWVAEGSPDGQARYRAVLGDALTPAP